MITKEDLLKYSSEEIEDLLKMIKEIRAIRHPEIKIFYDNLSLENETTLKLLYENYKEYCQSKNIEIMEPSKFNSLSHKYLAEKNIKLSKIIKKPSKEKKVSKGINTIAIT